MCKSKKIICHPDIWFFFFLNLNIWTNVRYQENIISIVIIVALSEKCEHDVALVESIEGGGGGGQFGSEKHLLQIPALAGKI